MKHRQKWMHSVDWLKAWKIYGPSEQLVKKEMMWIYVNTPVLMKRMIATQTAVNVWPSAYLSLKLTADMVLRDKAAINHHIRTHKSTLKAIQSNSVDSKSCKILLRELQRSLILDLPFKTLSPITMATQVPQVSLSLDLCWKMDSLA